MRRLILTDEIMNFPKEFDKFKEEFKPLKNKASKDIGNLKGDNFERKVKERAPAYLGKIIKKCKVISIEKIAETLIII